MERYAKYKDSGIDWLGEIPEHWEVKKIKYLLNDVVDNRGKTPPFGLTGIPMLEAKQIQDDQINPIEIYEKFVTKDNVDKFVRKHLKIGDILLVTVGATAGKTAIIETKS